MNIWIVLCIVLGLLGLGSLLAQLISAAVKALKAQAAVAELQLSYYQSLISYLSTITFEDF